MSARGVVQNSHKSYYNSLEPDMGRLISECQNAFIKGRNIMDGVVSLHEILQESKRKKCQGVVLKLDFEKSYDKVD